MFNSSTGGIFLLRLLKSKPDYIIASCALSFFSSVCSVLSIILSVSIFSALTNNQYDITFDNLSYLVTYFLNKSIVLEQNNWLKLSIAISLSLWFVSILSTYLNSIIGIKYTKYLTDKMKYASFKLLSKTELWYYQRHKTEDILFIINREIDRAALAINSIRKMLVVSIGFLVFSCALLLISLRLALVTIIISGFTLFVARLLNNILKKKELFFSQNLKAYNRKTIEFLAGIDYIKNTGNESREYSKIADSMAKKSQAELDARIVSVLLNSVNKFLNVIIILLLAYISYYLYDRQVQIFIPVLIIYLSILFKLLPSIAQLKSLRRQFANNKLSIEIVDNFLNKIDKPVIKSGNIVFQQLSNSIELHNVVFAYPNHAQIILDKINLKIVKGNTIALVGASGAGKSTLVSLLSRLYEPIEGNITIDGNDISQYTIESLRKSIAVIAREPFLFNNSIFYNITYGLDNISLDEAIAAAKITKAYNFISHLPFKFDTEIGNRDTILSEAQRQLIVITRAFLSQPEIVILDDSMKNIDKPDRELVQNALDELCRDRTTVVITSRLTAIERADKIIILNKGKIVESGTHQQLLNHNGLYQRMCSAQFKSSQQSHQRRLAKKISKKLAHHANSSLSYDIRNNLNLLLDHLQLVNEGLIKDDLEQEKILDESYQSAKNMLASLREYERKISQEFGKND